MRNVINISLPEQMVRRVEKEVKKGKFASTSEYMRFLIDQDDNLISADDLLAMSKKADRDYRAGKLKKLDSLAELL